jgi:uncharacterized protein YaaW (UPF0174 family)
MRDILNKCTKKDIEFLSETLDSYLSLTNDSGRKELLGTYDNKSQNKDLLILIDKQIRYYGSSDLAHIKRSVFGKDDGGVSGEELIDDVCDKLGVKIKHGGSTEKKLERLVNAVIEKELFSKSPEELKAAFQKFNIGVSEIDLILDHIKRNGKVAVLPILTKIMGQKVALAVIETIVVSLIAQFIGKEAAKVLVKELIKRNPWLNALGPIMWGLSAAWLTFDLQGPAYRKTVPICLYLGIVALRDGAESE